MPEFNDELLPMDVFPSVSWFKRMIHYSASEVLLDIHSNWQKQTGRTRYEIAGPNKRQQLVIPIDQSTRKTWEEVEISYAEDWQTAHWRSLEAGYNRSPYFEYYKDELRGLFERQPTLLINWNLGALDWMMKKLSLPHTVVFPRKGLPQHSAHQLTLTAYPQVFENRHGFLSNLSMLDALFNLGPEAVTLLR